MLSVMRLYGTWVKSWREVSTFFGTASTPLFTHLYVIGSGHRAETEDPAEASKKIAAKMLMAVVTEGSEEEGRGERIVRSRGVSLICENEETL
jgi:hypothetical protein